MTKEITKNNSELKVLSLELQRNVVRSSENQDIIKDAESFANKAYKLRSKTKLIALWNDEYTKLKEVYFYTDTTIKAYISVYRKTIIKRYNINEADISLKYRDLIKTLKVTKSLRIKQFIWLYNAVNIDYEIKKQIEKTDRIRTKTKTKKGERVEVLNVVKMIETAKANLFSSKYSKVCLSLELLTGRRTGEVLKTAKFKKINKYELQFIGKIKGATNKEITKKYTIPCLCDASLIVKSLKHLRKLKSFEGKTLKNVNSTVSKTLDNMTQTLFKDAVTKCDCLKCKQRNEYKGISKDTLRMKSKLNAAKEKEQELFEALTPIAKINYLKRKIKEAEINNKQLCKKLTPHSLRGIYAIICNEIFNTGNSGADSNYIADILLHGENDTSTSIRYQKIFMRKSEKERLCTYYNV